MALVGVIGWPQETNVELAAAWRDRGIPAEFLSPSEGASLLQPDDVAVGRLDVLRTLDGIEPGLHVLSDLAHRNVRVLNDAHALLRAHDKLLTAVCLERAKLHHPRTLLLEHPETQPPIEPPFVLKPRFGSWGADVFRCRTPWELEAVFRRVSGRPWFRRHGAIVQELLPLEGHDLRVIVAGGRVVGAVRRIAAPGEWRTNMALGGTREPVDPPEEARRLSLEAAAAIGADLVGVDLIPVGDGYVVLELNGAVEFDEGYDLPGGDIYLDTAEALGLVPAEVAA
jgi:[lysine-biosynthesis-protein LysW]--L-2-aminoadipate ligase